MWVVQRQISLLRYSVCATMSSVHHSHNLAFLEEELFPTNLFALEQFSCRGRVLAAGTLPPNRVVQVMIPKSRGKF